MINLKLIDERRIDSMIEKCTEFIAKMTAKDTLTQEELRFVLIMEGQLMAYKMIKKMELKPLQNPIINYL